MNVCKLLFGNFKLRSETKLDVLDVRKKDHFSVYLVLMTIRRSEKHWDDLFLLGSFSVKC